MNTELIAKLEAARDGMLPAMSALVSDAVAALQRADRLESDKRPRGNGHYTPVAVRDTAKINAPMPVIGYIQCPVPDTQRTVTIPVPPDPSEFFTAEQHPMPATARMEVIRAEVRTLSRPDFYSRSRHINVILVSVADAVRMLGKGMLFVPALHVCSQLRFDMILDLLDPAAYEAYSK